MWEADEDGFYDVRYDDDRVAARAHLVTHIFVRGDDLLDRDSVFGVKASLVKDFTRQPAGTPTPDGRDLDGRSWSRVRFDIVLAPAGV